MGRSLMEKEDLAKLFDKAIDDVRRKSGAGLSTLASVIESLAEATDVPIYKIVHWSIGFVGSQIIQFCPYATLPIVPEDAKPRCKEVFERACNEVGKALTEIKRELCGEGEPNYENLIKNLATGNA